MKLYEEHYSPEELRLMRRDSFDSLVTYDHFDPYRFNLTERERMERERYGDEPCLNLRGWRTLRIVGIVLSILTALILIFGREAGASSLSVPETLDALWALDREDESDLTGGTWSDWDLETEVGEGWLMPEMAEEAVAKVDEFPERLVYPEETVAAIHSALTHAGYRVIGKEQTRHIFGPSTSRSVKRFQIDNRLEPTGVVEGKTAELLGVTDSGAHYEVDLEEVGWKSKTDYIVLITTNPRKPSGPVLSVFYRAIDPVYGVPYWRLYAQYEAAIGAATEYGNLTPVGIFLPTFFLEQGEMISGKRYYYQVGFTTDLAILSVGYDPETETFENWTIDRNDERRRAVKGRLTGGSVRVEYDVAAWLYDIITDDTYIVIDDRNYGL